MDKTNAKNPSDSFNSLKSFQDISRRLLINTYIQSHNQVSSTAAPVTSKSHIPSQQPIIARPLGPVMATTGRRQLRHVNSISDGEQRQWPPKPYRPTSEEKYLEVLGNAWVKHDGLGDSGVEYRLDKLPDGYALFEIDQVSGPNIYKRLFGHPTGKYFDSTQKFLPHFLWLMDGMEGNCTCKLCDKGKSTKPRPEKPTFAAKTLVWTKPVVPRPNARKPRFVPEPSLIISERRNHGLDVDSNDSSRSTSLAGRSYGTSTRPQRQIKASGAPYAVDPLGHEDVYKGLVRRLWGAKDSKNGIEDDILQPNTMDWRAGHEYDGQGRDIIERCFTSVAHQHSFIPRVGELVLWIPHFLDDHYLMVDDSTEHGEFKFYSPEQKCFHGHPAWRGGVVAEAPIVSSLSGPIDFPDIQCLTEKRTSLNTSGFRVETFPDPNDENDKAASKQYRYVPLRSIRPLSHWHVLLRGIPGETWHSSITHALTCMTSLSLMEKFWFKGDWPNAKIFSKGIYLGAELITIGDVVRIKPPPSKDTRLLECTDVMIVDQIRVHLCDIRQDQVSADSEQLASSYFFSLKGRAYTRDAHRAFDHVEVSGSIVSAPVDAHEIKAEFRAVGAMEYGPWYRLHDPTKFYAVSQDMVLGRLYEAGAVQLWTGQLQAQSKLKQKPNPSLSFDIHGILEGRRYATKHDMRLDEAPVNKIRWFWADDRAEALDLEIFNGVKVGRYADYRDKETQEQWRQKIKIVDGHAVEAEYNKFTSFTDFTIPGVRGRKPGSKVINGKVVYPGQPGYDEVAPDEPELSQSTPRKHNSQLAGAVMVSTDEESSSEDGEEYEDALEEVDPASFGIDNLSVLDSGAVVQARKRPIPRTKQEIMASVEGGMELDDDESSDEEDWLADPLPLARGGTEESEGGDYRPQMD